MVTLVFFKVALAELTSKKIVSI